jgi:AcrR family transcriptional regulator
VTFTKVSEAAGVPERTVYRHFRNRAELLQAVFDRVNDEIGFDGELPTDAATAKTLVRQVFPGFDAFAPVDRGASDGSVDDLGAFRSLWFEDPDGMRGELTVIIDPMLAGIHEPRPMAASS